jgi:hypothetical protein
MRDDPVTTELAAVRSAHACDVQRIEWCGDDAPQHERRLMTDHRPGPRPQQARHGHVEGSMWSSSDAEHGTSFTIPTMSFELPAQLGGGAEASPLVRGDYLMLAAREFEKSGGCVR